MFRPVLGIGVVYLAGCSKDRIGILLSTLRVSTSHRIGHLTAHGTALSGWILNRMVSPIFIHVVHPPRAECTLHPRPFGSDLCREAREETAARKSAFIDERYFHCPVVRVGLQTGIRPADQRRGYSVPNPLRRGIDGMRVNSTNPVRRVAVAGGRLMPDVSLFAPSLAAKRVSLMDRSCQ
jgi:hypothetical protein